MGRAERRRAQRLGVKAPSNVDTVVLAYLAPGEVADVFHRSMMDLLMFDTFHGGQHIVNGGRLWHKTVHAGGVATGRQEVADAFLEQSDCDWLWFLDSDMGFDPDTLERLVATADPVERPIVGGLCFGLQSDGDKAHGGIRFRPKPTIYRAWLSDAGDDFAFVPDLEYERDAVVPVDATGTACLLIHRSALERICEHVQFPFHPLWLTTGEQRKLSEDLTFCVHAKAAGLPIVVDTSIKTTHYKHGVFLDEQHYDEWREWYVATKGAADGDRGSDLGG